MADSRVTITIVRPEVAQSTKAFDSGAHLAAYFYPAEKAYLRGADTRTHFSPGTIMDIDLGVLMGFTTDVHTDYTLPSDLAKQGILFSGIYMGPNSLHAVFYNPQAPNVWLDNGTVVLYVHFSTRWHGEIEIK